MRMKWLLCLLGLSIVAYLAVLQVMRPLPVVVESVPIPVSVNAAGTVSEAPVEPVAEAATPVVPRDVLWQAPFTTQAPLTDWDAFHEEMCEEASLLVANSWFTTDMRETIPAAEAEQQLTDMAAWERVTLGTDVSTTVDQMYQVATEYLKIPSSNLRVVTVSSVDGLQELVSQGVVVAPFAGRQLHNPHFTGAGPRYHALVIIGYTDREFITHDVGTRHGASYRYPTTVLWSALHDYVAEPGDIATGAKTVLALTRP